TRSAMPLQATWLAVTRWILHWWYWLLFPFYGVTALGNAVTLILGKNNVDLQSIVQVFVPYPLQKLWAANPPLAVTVLLGIASLTAASWRAHVSEQDLVPQGVPYDEPPNLPAHVVGRKSDLEWLLKRLGPGTEVGVTAITGLGGIGKSTLAYLAIQQLRKKRRFKGGIAIVPCLGMGMSDPAEVVRRVLARFDPERRRPEESTLADLADVAHRLLDGKKTLIMLDNVEPSLPIEQ